MAMNIPYRGQIHFKSSLSTVPESTQDYKPWSAPPSTIVSPATSSASERFLLPASLPERADAMLSKSLIEQCRLESSSHETSPRSSLNSHHPCGSWKSRAGGIVQKPPSKSGVIPLPCSSESLSEGRLLRGGRFTKRESTPVRSPDAHKSALSAALSGSGSPSVQVDLGFIFNRFAQLSYRRFPPPYIDSRALIRRGLWLIAAFREENSTACGRAR